MSEDRTADQALQGSSRGPLSESSLLVAAQFCRRMSRYFGWPALVLYWVGPDVELSALVDKKYLLLVGGPAVLLGLVLRIWARGYQRQEGFVLDGPYRYVRNPVELGAVLVYWGVGILLDVPWWYSSGLVLLAMAYLSLVGLATDRDLSLSLGPLYLRYARRVRRWIPSLLPGANRSHRTYSLFQALHFERESLLWALGFFVVMTLKVQISL